MKHNFLPEKQRRTGFVFLFSIVISLALVSFLSCIAAETKKLKKKEVRVQNELCSLAQSQALGFGVAALVCLVIAQAVSNLVICTNFFFLLFCSSTRKHPPITAIVLFLLSWASFGVAAVLLGGATSMSGRQGYGEGWVDGKCYVVKDGIYVGCGLLTLVSTAAALGSAIVAVRKAQVEQGHKIHT